MYVCVCAPGGTEEDVCVCVCVPGGTEEDRWRRGVACGAALRGGWRVARRAARRGGRGGAQHTPRLCSKHVVIVPIPEQLHERRDYLLNRDHPDDGLERVESPRRRLTHQLLLVAKSGTNSRDEIREEIMDLLSSCQAHATKYGRCISLPSRHMLPNMEGVAVILPVACACD